MPCVPVFHPVGTQLDSPEVPFFSESYLDQAGLRANPPARLRTLVPRPLPADMGAYVV